MMTEHIKQTRHKPHDKLFFASFRHIKVVESFCHTHLPASFCQVLNFDGMQPYETKKLTDDFKEFESDILYSIPRKDDSGDCMFFAHMEHQSKSERKLPLRIWVYLLLLLLEYIDNHPQKPLPVVWPIVVYTGYYPYCHSTNLFDLFGENKQLMQTWLNNPIKVLDIANMPDEEVEQQGLFSLAAYAYKHRFVTGFKQYIDKLMGLAKEHYIEHEGLADSYYENVLKYAILTKDNIDINLLDEVVEQHFGTERGKKIMTGAQLYEQRGEKNRSIEIAQSLLQKNMPLDEIAEITKLSLAEMQQFMNTKSGQVH